MSINVVKLHDGSLKLSEKLRMLLNERNLSVIQFAQELKIPEMTVRRLLSGETTDPRISTLKLVADYFGIAVDYLLDENTHLPLNAATNSRPVFVPVLTWEAAEKINSIKELDLTKWKNWQPVSLNEQNAISKSAFALESRPSMYPRFPQETLFILDPEVDPADGDIVLVKIKKNNELTIRELSINPPEWRLQSIVPGYSALNYDQQEHFIIGVNLLTLLYNRRIYD